MTRYALTNDFEKLLDVPITERGQNSMVRCPFHPDDRASLSIDLERGFWICFGCGERGTIFSMAQKLNQVLDSDDVLARSSRADQPRDEPHDFHEKAEALYFKATVDKPLQMVRYFTSRGLHPLVLHKFILGWDGNRISMPYYDDDKVVAIKYRYPDGFKSYEQGSIHYLYNVNSARRGTEQVIICEGESDTHAVWSNVADHDIMATVGVPGVGNGMPSRATWELYALELLWAKRIYIAFDADNAGDAGAELAMSVLGPKAKRMRPTKGNDMAEHLMKGGTLAEAGMDGENN